MVKPSNLPRVNKVFVLSPHVEPRKDCPEVIDLTSGDSGNDEPSGDEFADERPKSKVSIESDSSFSTQVSGATQEVSIESDSSFSIQVSGATQVRAGSVIASHAHDQSEISSNDPQVKHLKNVRDRVLVSVAAKKGQQIAALSDTLSGSYNKKLKVTVTLDQEQEHEHEHEQSIVDILACASEPPVSSAEGTDRVVTKRLGEFRLKALRSAALRKRKLSTTKNPKEASEDGDSSGDRNSQRDHGDTNIHYSNVEDFTGGNEVYFVEQEEQEEHEEHEEEAEDTLEVSDRNAGRDDGKIRDVEQGVGMIGNVMETLPASSTPPIGSLVASPGKANVTHDSHDTTREIERLQAQEHLLAHKIEVQTIRNEINRNEALLAFQTSKLTKARQVHDNLCRVEREQFRLLCSLRKTKQQLLERSAKASLSRIELMADVSSARYGCWLWRRLLQCMGIGLVAVILPCHRRKLLV